MNITFYGHSCFQIEVNGKKLLFDPFISPNPMAAHIDVAAIKPDYVLLSHGHEDHVADAEQILKQSGATLISNYEIVTWYAAKGIANFHPMNIGGSKDFDFGKLKMVRADHSSMLPDRSYGGNPAGFILEFGEHTIYYAGDTDLFNDMKMIGELHKPDMAFLPIGDNFTMGYESAAIAAEYLGVKEIVGMHYNTFPYIEISNLAALEHFNQKGLQLLLPGIGESLTF
jgi:L-ascorbate metabolism protein UlaG (beta-lactamase superfamily)